VFKRTNARFAASLLLIAAASAQTPTQTDKVADAQAPAAAAPAAAAPPKSPWTQWGTDFSILLDGYVDGNFNHPDSGFNGIRNFDVRADNVHLSMAKLTIDHAPGPFGFHADVGFGQTFDMVHSADLDYEGMKYIEQAYVSLKPKSWKGLQVDAGKFVTSAGAEVIEAYSNWNYSRSILFSWAIPYYHLGLRASFPVGSHFTGGVQVVNGWNNVKDNNSGKTVGLTGAYAWKKVTWTTNYYGGPENPNTNSGMRNLFDTTVQVNPNDKLSYYINFDYGRNKYSGSGAAQWTGIAGAARYAIGKKWAFAPRVEFYNDMDGYTTGTKQQLKEITLTGEYKWNNWLVSRLEFRNDWSNEPFFEKEGGKTSKTQPTILFAMMAYFGPHK
jgi:hypothetical protein